MPLCPLCGQPMSEGACPRCGVDEQALLRALKPGVFPATAFPPDGLNASGPALDLKRALVRGDLERAETLWESILRTLRPLGRDGRRQLADCFEACAALLEARSRPKDAEGMRRRALSMRKDPAALIRRPSAAQGPGWDSHPWLRAQAGDLDIPAPETLRRARAEFERVQTANARRRGLLAVGLAGFAGLWCAVVTGLPGALLVPVGLGLGWLWARRA